MFNFIKKLFKSDKIESDALVHSSFGEYTKTNRLKSGGHGQEALDYMKKNQIPYNISKQYPNGVRIGNVPNHEKVRKRAGDNQSWFPRNWDRKKIEKAGNHVARGKKYPDGSIKSRTYEDVMVGIIRTNGKIATIFPLSNQNKRRDKDEQQKTKKPSRKSN